MTNTKYPIPTEEGLYQSGSQVWRLSDDGFWDEIHGDGAEFGDHPFVRLVPEEPKPVVASAVIVNNSFYGVEEAELKGRIEDALDLIEKALEDVKTTVAPDARIYLQEAAKVLRGRR